MSGTAVEKEVSVKSHNFSWLQLSKRKGQPFSVIVQFFMKAIFNFPAQKIAILPMLCLYFSRKIRRIKSGVNKRKEKSKDNIF